MRWLHISDIHFNFKGFENSNVRNKLIEKLKELALKIDFILITGDCIYKYGKEGLDIDEIASYIKDIAKSCGCPKKQIYICQGNHDLNRDDLDRNSLIDSILKGEKDYDFNYENLNKNGNEKFQLLISKVNNDNYESYKVYSPKGKKYRIISLNSCLLSKDNNDFGRLRICNSHLNKIENEIPNDDNINILIMHHGIDFLEAKDAIKFEHWVEDHNIDMVFTGHTHRAAIQTFDNSYRDIEQFTAGAIVVDGYAIPSFSLCEYDGGCEVSIKLFSYSIKTETWINDNDSLRKFKNGSFNYKLARKWGKRFPFPINIEDQLKECKQFIKKLTQMYMDRYGVQKIYSSLNNLDESENFDVNKIIRSLGAIGMPFDKSLDIACEVVTKITQDNFKTNNDYLSCRELRDIIYEQIITQKSDESNSELMLGCWASRYARMYKRESEIIVTTNNAKHKMNYAYIQQDLLKRVFDTITGSETFYLKVFKKEIQRMSERILEFLKNMGIFEIREEILDSLLIEYISQKPHPWVVNGNKEQLLKYHLEQADSHIRVLESKPSLLMAQTEASYHIFAAFLVQYDKVIGCTETYPIAALHDSLKRMNNEENMYNRLPIYKYQVFQLKKDLEMLGVNFISFNKDVTRVYENIVTKQDVTNAKTVTALTSLWKILLKLKEKRTFDIKCYFDKPIERVRYIFRSGLGFIIKAITLRTSVPCFLFEPNWMDYEEKQQHLGKQILVCVINNVSDIDEIYKLLLSQKNRNSNNLSEIIFAYSNYESFTKDERSQIRAALHSEHIKCIFIQEENYAQISDLRNWREILFEVIRISKFS